MNILEFKKNRMVGQRKKVSEGGLKSIKLNLIAFSFLLRVFSNRKKKKCNSFTYSTIIFFQIKKNASLYLSSPSKYGECQKAGNTNLYATYFICVFDHKASTLPLFVYLLVEFINQNFFKNIKIKKIHSQTKEYKPH